jgi:hypothetical protein
LKKKELKFQILQGFKGHYAEFGKENLYIIYFIYETISGNKMKMWNIGFKVVI